MAIFCTKFLKTIICCLAGFVLSAQAFAKDPKAVVSFGVSQPLLVLIADNVGKDADESSDTPAKELVFAPDIPTIGTLGLSYNHLSASVSHNLDDKNENKLSYSDYRLGLFFSVFGIDASYSDFKSFEITMTEGFAQNVEGGGVYRPKMSSRFLASNIYIFPLRFNFDLDQTMEPDELKKTGLGLGTILSVTETSISTPDGLIPAEYQQEFGDDGRFSEGVMRSFNGQIAMAFTLAPGPLYLSGLIAVGLGNQIFDYTVGEETRAGSGIADKEDYMINFGYSAKRSFLSFSYTHESPRYILKDMAIAAESSNLAVEIGIKF